MKNRETGDDGYLWGAGRQTTRGLFQKFQVAGEDPGTPIIWAGHVQCDLSPDM